jgi:tetratricopeptide (TPR) repeat protein
MDEDGSVVDSHRNGGGSTNDGNENRNGDAEGCGNGSGSGGGSRGSGVFVLDAMRSKFDGGLRLRGDHPTSSGIARRRPPTDPRSSNGNRADDDETTVGEGHIAVVAGTDSGGGEESSSVPPPPPVVVLAPPMEDTTTATASSPPAAKGSGRVTIPSFLKTREESTFASVVVVPSVDECATTEKTVIATTDEIASPVPAAATAAVPVVAIGGDGSTSASSPGGGTSSPPPAASGRKRVMMPSFLKSTRAEGGPYVPSSMSVPRPVPSPPSHPPSPNDDDAVVVVVPSVSECASTKTVTPLIPAAAVPVVSIGGDESTSASSPGGGTGGSKKSTARHRPWSKSGGRGIVNVAVDRRSLASENSKGYGPSRKSRQRDVPPSPPIVEGGSPSDSETNSPSRPPPPQSRAWTYQGNAKSHAHSSPPSTTSQSSHKSRGGGSMSIPTKFGNESNNANVVVAPSLHAAPPPSKHNMIAPRSRQRLILERVAAQYFLRDASRHAARYVGASDYGTWDADFAMENTTDDYNARAVLPGSAIATNRDGMAVLTFLEGAVTPFGVDDERHDDSNEGRGSDRGVVAEAIPSAGDDGNLVDSAEGSARDVAVEADIDCILEIASDHLSLGRNDLALEAYRRAMKVAFADVISVKKKLMEVRGRQDNLDPSATDLTRDEEQQFELSLLKVASRVADVHNNMGVVHEMNRHYEKAKSSYMDALEVYHNTCKRFEEKGDPDVDRTKKNIERMTLACNSEHKRKALHERASGIAKKLDGKIHPNERKNLLCEVVATLRGALALESETIGLTHPVAAGTLIQIGKYHYEMREFDSAVLEIRQAVTIFRNALGDSHPQVGKSTLLLASIYERHGLQISPRGTCKDDSELELYVDALGPLKAALGEVHTEIGFLYSKIGYLYWKKGILSLSFLAYKASLKAYGEPCLNEINLEVMSIWVRITEYLTNLKAWDDVLVAGRRALYLLRRSRNILFSSGSALASVSATTTSTIPVTATRRSQIRITVDTYNSSLFATLQSLGQAHTSRSEYALARDACSESLQLGWDMALSASKDNAENEALTESITRVVKALKRLGKAYLLEKHYAPALECFLPSLELLRSSQEMESTLECASVLGSLGFLHLKLKKYGESSNFLRECLRLYRQNGEI